MGQESKRERQFVPIGRIQLLERSFCAVQLEVWRRPHHVAPTARNLMWSRTATEKAIRINTPKIPL